MTPETALLILKVLGVVSAGLRLAPELQRQRDLYISQIEEMIRAGRDPSGVEFDALIAEGDMLTASILATVAARSE